jgi:transposase
MTVYTHFIGIDIGKFSFVVAQHGSRESKEYDNNCLGMSDFLKDYKKILSKSLCILETTGGYEMELLYLLCDRKIAVHRADTRKVKNFIRSYGNSAKTDHLDSLALARYGYERHGELGLFVLPSSRSSELFRLTQRRLDLKQMVIAEKNRSKAPENASLAASFIRMIEVIDEQVELMDKAIAELIGGDALLNAKKAVLMSIPGIGEIISNQLLALLPELGTLDRRKIAALAGLAPIARDSGIYKGYRRTGHGRNGVKPALFMAAMAARNSKSHLKEFYEKLTANGKKKMVALTALMRKILVIANAKIKNLHSELKHS